MKPTQQPKYSLRSMELIYLELEAAAIRCDTAAIQAIRDRSLQHAHYCADWNFRLAVSCIRGCDVTLPPATIFATVRYLLPQDCNIMMYSPFWRWPADMVAYHTTRRAPPGSFLALMHANYRRWHAHVRDEDATEEILDQLIAKMAGKGWELHQLLQEKAFFRRMLENLPKYAATLNKLEPAVTSATLMYHGNIDAAEQQVSDLMFGTGQLEAAWRYKKHGEICFHHSLCMIMETAERRCVATECRWSVLRLFFNATEQQLRSFEAPIRHQLRVEDPFSLLNAQYIDDAKLRIYLEFGGRRSVGLCSALADYTYERLEAVGFWSPHDLRDSHFLNEQLHFAREDITGRRSLAWLKYLVQRGDNDQHRPANCPRRYTGVIPVYGFGNAGLMAEADWSGRAFARVDLRADFWMLWMSSLWHRAAVWWYLIIMEADELLQLAPTASPDIVKFFRLTKGLPIELQARIAHAIWGLDEDVPYEADQRRALRWVLRWLHDDYWQL